MLLSKIVKFATSFLLVFMCTKALAVFAFFDDEALIERSRALAGAASFVESTNRIIIIGDSLSDSEQRLNAMTGGFFPGSIFYWKGHLSNGPLWNEYLAATLGLPMYSYSTAGSRIAVKNQAAGITHLLDIPSALDAVNEMTQKGVHFSPQDVVFLWIGANDFLSEPDWNNIQTYTDQMRNLLTRLVDMDASRVVIGFLPPFYKYLPTYRVGIHALYRTIGDPAEIDRMVVEFNKGLRKLTLELSAKYRHSKNVKFVTFDLTSLLETIQRDPSSFNIENIKDPCFRGMSFASLPFPPLPPLILADRLSTCNNPDRYVFWDTWHMTTRMQCLMSLAIIDQLSTQGWVKTGLELNSLDSYCSH